jgi:site-specific recombinase XerD
MTLEQAQNQSNSTITTTLPTAVAGFLRDVSSGHSPATTRTYRFVLSQFSRYLEAYSIMPLAAASFPIADLQTDWAVSFMRQLASGESSAEAALAEGVGIGQAENIQPQASSSLVKKTKKGAAKASLAVYAATLMRFYRWCSLERLTVLPSDELERLALRLRELRGKQKRTILNKVPADDVVEALLTQARLDITLLQAQVTQLAVTPSTEAAVTDTSPNGVAKRVSSLNRHDQLRHYLQAQRNLALVETLKSSGARVSEICNLTRGDLDATNRRALVVGKGDKERWIYFNPSAWQAVQTYMNIRTRLLSQLAAGIQPHLAAEVATTPTPILSRDTNLSKKRARLNLSELAAQPVFARHDRRAGLKEVKPLAPRTVQRNLWELVERAELETYITPHKFRHWFATKMLAATGDLAVTQDLLGHANPATTRIYAQVSETRKQEAHRQLFES